MAKRSSSGNWRRRQDSDPYVRRAQAEGWRSRAVFKLMEVQERDKLIGPGHRILDLGPDLLAVTGQPQHVDAAFNLQPDLIGPAELNRDRRLIP